MVTCPFGEDRVVLLEMQDVKVGEGRAQHRGRVHVLGVRGAAGAIPKLLGTVTLEQEQTSGRERALNALEDGGAQSGPYELDEDRGNDVEPLGLPRPGLQVCFLGLERDTLFSSEPPCLGEGDG